MLHFGISWGGDKSYTARSRIDKAKEEIKQINEYKKQQTKAGRAYF